jgi:hypothetical protein
MLFCRPSLDGDFFDDIFFFNFHKRVYALVELFGVRENEREVEKRIRTKRLLIIGVVEKF